MKNVISFLIVISLSFLPFLDVAHADPLPDYEFHDLNDNQVPAGWILEVGWGNGGIQDGRLIARIVAADVNLIRLGTLPAGAAGIKLEYDGNISYTYSGMVNGVILLAGSDSFTVCDGMSVYMWGWVNRARMWRDSPNIAGGLIYSGDYPLEYTDYHYTVIFTEGQISYKAVKITDGSVLFDITANDARVHMAEVQGIMFSAYATTDNDCWVDNLQLEVLYGGDLGLLVNNASALDAEEQAAHDFAASRGFTVTIIDPALILANPAILDSVKGFWAPNATEPAGFNDPTIISALQGEIQNGKRILLDWYGFYLGQYLGLGNAYIGSGWYPVVSDHIYWVDKKTDHPVFQNMSPWILPSGPPDDETKLIKYVNPVEVPGGPCFDVTAPFDTLKYVYLWATYGWPFQNPDPALCAEYGITCTTERGIYVSWIQVIHAGCGSAILQHAFLPTMTALDHWHFGQAGYQLLENILSYVCSGYLLGDANGDGKINVGDVVYLINYLFIDGPAPDPIARGDVNRDNSVNITDVVYLINYLFVGGPSPCEGKLLSSSESSTSLSKSAGTARIGFSEAKGSKDNQIEVSVFGDFNVDVSGLQLEISYDPKEVTLLEPSLTSRTQGLQLYSSTKDGIQKIGILDINGRNHILPGQGPLVTLRAKGSDLSSLVIKEAILVDKDAHTIPVEIVKTIGTTEDNSVPQNFSLAQNYPNPFNPSTRVQFTVASGQSSVPTTLKIYNVRGQLVRTLVDEPKISGTYEVIWDGKDDRGEVVSSGVYFYKLKAGDYSETKKMILMK